VQPSSLVFLVLVVIWAAYLLQHWVRRREHLAMARSVDRFSAAMHVLERRNPLPELNLSAPSPRSYDVSPARPSRPEIVVKNAHSPAPNVPMDPAAAVRSTRIFRVLAGVSARRLRGLSLLASLSLVVVVVLLTAFSVLTWWAVPVVVAVLAADIVWLRYRALSERAFRQASPSGRDADMSWRGSDADPVRSDLWGSAEFESELDPGPEPDPEPVVEAPIARAADAAGPPGLPAEVDPSGWAPVPVPPPTYTLKAQAVPPAFDTVPGPVGESAPAQSTSLDGLVYDYDLDELVERRQPPGPEQSVRAV